MHKTNSQNKAAAALRRSFGGDLGLVSAANLFQLIKLASLSGHLMVTSEANATHFFFSEGRLSYAISRQGRKKIGQTLLEDKLITDDILKSCLEDQKGAESWQKIGSILVEKGYLHQSQLAAVFHKQLKSALLETMSWKEGKFRFIDTSPLVEGDVILEEDIETHILQSLIMLDELKN